MDSRHEKVKKIGGRKEKDKKAARHVAKSKEESSFIWFVCFKWSPKYLLTKRKACGRKRLKILENKRGGN